MPSGNIYVTFSGQRGQKVPVSLYKVTANHSIKPFITEMMNPTGLAIDRDGFLYVSCRNDGTIHRISPDGRAMQWIEGMGIATGLAFDKNGSLYVGDRSGTIFKIGPDREIFVFATLEPSVAAYHLAFSPAGDLFVSGPDHFELRPRVSDHARGRSERIFPRTWAGRKGLRSTAQGISTLRLPSEASAASCASRRTPSRKWFSAGAILSVWRCCPRIAPRSSQIRRSIPSIGTSKASLPSPSNSLLQPAIQEVIRLNNFKRCCGGSAVIN